MSRRNTSAPVAAIAALIAAVVVVAAPARFAQAVIIIIPNASFESPNLADGAFTDTLSNPTNAIPAWTFTPGPTTNGIISAGVWDPGVPNPPTTDGYTVAGGNNTPLPGDAAGGQNAYIYLDQDTNTVPEPLTGDLDSFPIATIESNTLYTLTVALGRAKGVHTGDVTISLVAENFPLASITVAPDQMPDDTFTRFVLEFPTFEDYPFAGLELSARITHTYSGPGAVSLDIDNVRFKADPVPEPGSASLALLAMGALAPTFRRRRRR
jgi:hypothetical protein